MQSMCGQIGGCVCAQATAELRKQQPRKAHNVLFYEEVSLFYMPHVEIGSARSIYRR